MNVTDHFRESYAREKKLVMLNVIQLAPEIYGSFPIAYAPGRTVSAAYKADLPRVPSSPLLLFEQSVRMPVQEVSFWPNIIGEPEVEWVVPNRKRLVRKELADRWRLLPQASKVAPFVYVKAGTTKPP